MFLHADPQRGEWVPLSVYAKTAKNAKCQN